MYEIEVNILLAEDDIVNQKIIKYMIEKKKANLTIVNNGREVLDILKYNSFDLILMDIYMPKMNGIKTALEIRKLGITIPIIAITAADMIEDKEKYLKSGIQECISKPVNPHELYNTIGKFIGNKLF